VLGLVAGNVVDYVRFHHAIARARGLTEAQLRAMGIGAGQCQTGSNRRQRGTSGVPDRSNHIAALVSG